MRHRRNQTPYLAAFLVGLLVSSVGCGDANIRGYANTSNTHNNQRAQSGGDQNNDQSDGQQPDDEGPLPDGPPAGENHDFNFSADGNGGQNFEAGSEMAETLVEPETSFQDLKITLGGPTPDFEYQSADTNGAWTEWVTFVPTTSVSESHEGYVHFDQVQTKLRFRSNNPLDFARLTFFEDLAAAASDQETQSSRLSPRTEGGTDRITRGRALTKPGDYDPPPSVTQFVYNHLGNSHQANGPAWGGVYYNPPNATGYCVANRRCHGFFREGVQDLTAFLESKFSGISHVGGYCCRPNTNSSSVMSVHGTGRAADLFITEINGDADNDAGDPVANYIATHAAELHVSFFIWDRTKFNLRYGFKHYSGTNAHTDHIHIELDPGDADNPRSSFPEPGSPSAGNTEHTGDDHAGGSTNPLDDNFNPHFADDDQSSHEDDINTIYNDGVTRGCSGGAPPNYCPADNLKRGNMAVMLMRAFDVPRGHNDYFSDDSGGVEIAANALAGAGLTAGCSAGSFCPDAQATMGQVAKLLVRIHEVQESQFMNEAQAVSALVNGGVIERPSCEQPASCASESLTRAEFASLLVRQPNAQTQPDDPGEPDSSEPAALAIDLKWSDPNDDFDLELRVPSSESTRYPVSYSSGPVEGFEHQGDTCPSTFGLCNGQPDEAGYFHEIIRIDDPQDVPPSGTAIEMDVEDFKTRDGGGGDFELTVMVNGEVRKRWTPSGMQEAEIRTYVYDSTGGQPEQQCVEDAHEDNDRSTTATDLTTAKTISDVRMCGNLNDDLDRDWFKLGLTAVGASVDVDYPAGQNSAGASYPQLRLSIYCGASYCATAMGSNGHISTTVPDCGTCNYTAYVFSNGGNPTAGTPFSITRR